MIFKVAIPGKVQFKIIKKEPNFFMTKQGDIHYIGGTEVLPPPLEVEKEMKRSPYSLNIIFVLWYILQKNSIIQGWA